MNISIFGATGVTGKLLTNRALGAGHKVKVLARDPQAFPFRDRVDTIRGDAKDFDAVRETVLGSELVFSTLGARSLGKEEVLERAVPLIISAMQEQSVRRIIVLGSAGVLPGSLDNQPAYRRWIVENIVYKTILKWPVVAQRAQYAALSASDLDWTMVMPPMLVNLPGRGSYRVDGDALPQHGSRISRADAADFMMLQIDNGEWMRKGVYICW